MTGQIQIVFRPDVPVSVRERVETVSAELRDKGISIASHQTDPNAGESVLIKVTEMGDISDIHVTAVLNAVFHGKGIKGHSVVLRDNERSFSLPDEMPECIDWFVIEK